MANESELRLHRCCFTGHRPEKLRIPESAVISGLEREIRKAIDDGFTVFISGMARGVDIWAAEIVLRLRGEGKPIRLIAAVPHDGFETRWSLDWQKRYTAILAAADLVKTLAPVYDRGCFQRRNEWMVDHSARLIAVFNGEPGGTKNTVDYARRRMVEIALIAQWKCSQTIEIGLKMCYNSPEIRANLARSPFWRYNNGQKRGSS